MASYDNLHRHERPELYVREQPPRWYDDRKIGGDRGPGREMPKRDRDNRNDRPEFRGPRTNMNYREMHYPGRDRDRDQRDERDNRDDRNRYDRRDHQRDRYDRNDRRDRREDRYDPYQAARGSRGYRERSPRGERKFEKSAYESKAEKALEQDMKQAHLLAGGDNEEENMMEMMGFSGSFATTKGKKVKTNAQGDKGNYGSNKPEERKYRQYMNRKGGFNRPLDHIGSKNRTKLS